MQVRHSCHRRCWKASSSLRETLLAKEIDISYADRRWSSGSLYDALDFKLDHISSPNYWYLDKSFSKRIYRYTFAKYKQKKLLKTFDPDLIELENMKANGYSWIWDCGNYVYVKTYDTCEV